jgi:hypothetical protein
MALGGDYYPLERDDPLQLRSLLFATSISNQNETKSVIFSFRVNEVSLDLSPPGNRTSVTRLHDHIRRPSTDRRKQNERPYAAALCLRQSRDS